jgi:hyperosmotically inducible protein
MNKKLAAACLIVGTFSLPLVACSTDSGSTSAQAKTYVKDSVITTKVKAELANEKVISLVHISVDTDNVGVVYLSGTASSQRAIDRAVVIARGVTGVTSVRSNIAIGAD